MILGLFCVTTGLPQAVGADPEKPNVLFIIVDDLNDYVGYLGGHPDARTPNIDRLAQQGTAFLHGHTAAPICNPSRVAFLTGLRPSHTGKGAENTVTTTQHFPNEY